MNNQAFEYWSNASQMGARMIERYVREQMEMASDCLSTCVKGTQEFVGARKIEDAVQAQTKLFAELSTKVMNGMQQNMENLMECASAGRKWFDGMAQNCCHATQGQGGHPGSGSTGKSAKSQ